MATSLTLDPETLPPYTMAVMDKTGDTRMQWDPNDPVEVAKVESRFNELRKKGYLAYKVSKKGTKGEVLTNFDAQAERIILSPQMVGG